ncbi:MAG: APC family permease [Acidobacteria bacterium]|nr:MAG: APC family permease [Acidobacteriota bacterium]
MPDQAAGSAVAGPGGMPRFKRVLSRGDLILYGLVILTPTAPYPVYGIVQQVSQGHAALSYLVAMVAMLFTAASYGKMSGAFPSAGSTYTYAQRALNEHVGFLAGWAMMLDYFLIPLLSVIYVALTAERVLPQIPYYGWAALSTIAITLINVRGIRVTARASTAMMIIMSACALLFIWLAARWVAGSAGLGGLVSASGFYRPESFALRPLMLGAAIATLSYIGFDAISTLAEDTLRPERDIAFATVTVCVLQTIFCVATVYLAALAWPDYQSFPQTETAILDIGRRIGGPWMVGCLTFVLVVAGLASALTGQAGASRLLYGMGREGVLPRSIFAYIDPRYSTPTRSIYLMGAISLIGAMAVRFQLAAELLNFGAFVGFILVNLSVVRHYYIRLGERRGVCLFTNLLFPLAGALVCSYVWMSLTGKAKLVGFGWLLAGVLYLAVLTRGFRVAPKKLEFS